MGLLAACVTEPDYGEATSASTVEDFASGSGCSTAVVLGLSTQIADEIGCANPTSLTPFTAGSGITITSNAVLPYLAANAKADLMAVGNVQVNSAFRTPAAQYLLLRWFQAGHCGITAAAAVGTSNHESGRAVDLANWSDRVTAMANQGWAHDVPGDDVHFDHLSSPDIRGQDTLAFQKLWNANNPGDQIAADGSYGPQTEARLKMSPATGFAQGASCIQNPTRGAQVVAIDGPDKVAPATKAHYTITVKNTGDVDWPASTKLVVAGGGTSPLYDSTSWQSASEVETIGVAVPAGTMGVLALDVLTPSVTIETPEQTTFALNDGVTEFGMIDLALTVTPNGDAGMSGDSGDQNDGSNGAHGGCSAGGGSGSLAFVALLLVVRRRRA